MTSTNGHDEVVLASFDYTHVLYDPDSTKSEILALFTLFPILLFASYAALIIVTRELTIITMLIGQLTNEVFNTSVKNILQVERPFVSHGNGYGFPSSHSQYMGFFATFLLLHLSIRHSFPSHDSPIIDSIVKVAVSLGVVVWAGLVAYSRYHLNYHTPFQVVGGVLIGVSFGAGWYTVTEYVPLRYPSSLLGRARTVFLDSPVVQWFRIRDGWAVYDDGGHEKEWIAWKNSFDAKMRLAGSSKGQRKRNK